MNAFKRFIFPIALVGSIGIGVASEMMSGPSAIEPLAVQCEAALPDTVIYPPDNYRARRKGNFDKVELADSLLGGSDSLAFAVADTTPAILARDTIKVPDSLRFTDPFRYRYYIAIVDSLTHRQTSDSLQHTGDSLRSVFADMADSLYWRKADTTFTEKRMLDSLYFRDSTLKAKAAFEKWYNSLDPDARKKYDFEQKEKRKMAVRDSLDAIKEEEKARKDSIRKATPRILEAYAMPESLYYKRIVQWTVDRDFQDLQKPSVPDTTFNDRFYDHPFQKEDVNATWLGVSGSPVQTYNYFLRKSCGVEFYDPLQSWSFSPSSLVNYNTKTPYTELAYFGTLLASDDKESDNIHILSTQNITPALNIQLIYDRWGGGGMLINEEVKNKTVSTSLNYLGKRYTAHAGFISNSVTAGENGGILDISEIRDTTLESREVKVAMDKALSTTKKLTFYGDQQYRFPIEFLPWGDSLTTGFVGHSFEYSRYGRTFANGAESDSHGQTKLDNKLYFRLQPWKEKAFISKIDLGIGDYVNSYHNVTATDTSTFRENSLYAYAGIKGFIGDNFRWNAKGHLVFAGADAGNADLSARAELEFYPFRKARKSPVSLYVQVSAESRWPSFYQRHMYSTINELYRWDNDFSNIGSAKLEGGLDIPHWRTSLKAGYALVGGMTWYDTLGVVKQYTDKPVSVFSADLRQEFVIGGLLHLDNHLLAQYSSNQQILPLPALALNLKWFLQFPVQPGVMDMQAGVNAWWNTKWYSPQWNYITGTFASQNEWQYNNGPYFDVFINLQWKKCCIFIKMQNLGKGWPMDHADYFSAHRHIITQNGTSGIKLGIWWPLYPSIEKNPQVSR